MKVLFLGDWQGVANTALPNFLKNAGHEVINPALDGDFERAVRTAQVEFDQHNPDAIVGSTRGGAVAMNINTGNMPLVLLSPAWKDCGTATTIKPNSMVVHPRQEEVVPFTDSVELISNSGLPRTNLIETDNDHKTVNPETLKTMLEACLTLRPRVAGCDFGVPSKAGDQSKKIIFIEAVRVGSRSYIIEKTGRNERLVRPFLSGGAWRRNRRGWTLPDLYESLSNDYSIKACSFDFPFSIPRSLLNDKEFAQCMGQAPFRTRRRWVEFVAENLNLEFDDDRAGTAMKDLSRFDKWRDKRYWQKRSTDKATNGSPPLKHMFQNVFAMTIAGASLVSRLSNNQYATVLYETQTFAEQSLFETYPREVANRIGFKGSYKDHPQDCLTQAVAFLQNRDITLDFDDDVRHFCENYRTSGNDPDGADAFLCLVASICFYEGMAEYCGGGADSATLCEEAAIIVPASN